ncbi:MAG: TatD family hydrolase, partial [Clostridia bacterium]|nr:TatD family hydrolase [Clostridia bacterium]
DENRDEILSEVFSNGVEKICNIGASLSSSRTSVELSKKYDNIYASVGVHPSDAVRDMQNSDWLEQLERLYTENEKVVSIGEIGLDYYWTPEEKEEQKQCFRAQMELSRKLGAPVIIHDREAHGDVLEIMREYPDVIGVVHSFSGSLEMAKEVLKMGYYISVNGVTTFKNARKIVEIVENLRDLHPDAMSRILVETDCPYLTPVPHRGETNRSDYIRFTAEKCGDLLGITAEEFCEITYRNACRFYGIN